MGNPGSGYQTLQCPRDTMDPQLEVVLSCGQYGFREQDNTKEYGFHQDNPPVYQEQELW